METRKIILTRGIPASGKSYWAKQWVLEDPEHRIRINRDDIRNMFGKYWVPEREGEVTKVEDAAIKAAMWKGYNIVIDNMNLNPKTIKQFESLIKMHNSDAEYARKPKPGIEDGVYDLCDYTLEFKDFYTPLEVCIERDSKRENPIGEKAIRDIWRKYKQDIWHRETMSKMNKLQTYNSTIEDCILVDMDGTLAFNLQGRPYYGEGAAEGIKYDAPLISTISIVRAMKMTGTCKVFIVTGRDISVMDETIQWLKTYNIPFDEIYMRNSGDYRKGEEVKLEIYNQYIKSHYNVLFVLDDDNKCADMYRENGLICLQP